MNQFTFHRVDQDGDQLYNYARDWDKALTALGPHIFDSVAPSLSRQVPTTGPDLGSLSYSHLLTQGNKETTCSIDSAMSREERINYANEIASTSQLVEMSKLSPFSFFNQRGIDRLTRASMDLKPRKRDWTSKTERLYDPYLNISSFEDLVQAASNGLNVHYSVTPTTRKAIK